MKVCIWRNQKTGEACDREVRREKGKLCEMHAGRRRRGQPMDAPPGRKALRDFRWLECLDAFAEWWEIDPDHGDRKFEAKKLEVQRAMLRWAACASYAEFGLRRDKCRPIPEDERVDVPDRETVE
jgi:hypothetical protein